MNAELCDIERAGTATMKITTSLSPLKWESEQVCQVIVYLVLLRSELLVQMPPFTEEMSKVPEEISITSIATSGSKDGRVKELHHHTEVDMSIGATRPASAVSLDHPARILPICHHISRHGSMITAKGKDRGKVILLPGRHPITKVSKTASAAW